jgi:hypothetical protein
MIERTVLVYSGDNFEKCDRYLPHQFKEHWEAGHIVERKMPYASKKKPDRTKTVYYWMGISDLSCQMRDLSAQMPPCVTELAAEGVSMFIACADAWRGVPTPAFRGLRDLPANIRLLINSVTYEDIPLDKEHGLETPLFA